MYFVTLGWSFALEPVANNSDRTAKAVLCFSAAAIVGWPFSILLAVPFVVEELFLRGRAGKYTFVSRLFGLIKGSSTSLALLANVVAVDSYFYGRLVVAPLNIIKYNVISSSSSGPNIFGTEPWYYYILNLALNFNLALSLALGALPTLIATHLYSPKRFGIVLPGQTSSFRLLAVRLSPVYLWFGVLFTQAHKEERFMFPIFPLLCFQAALTLALIRGWLEDLYVQITKASHQVGFAAFPLDLC